MKKKPKYLTFTFEITPDGRRIFKKARATKEDDRRIKRHLAKHKWKKLDL